MGRHEFEASVADLVAQAKLHLLSFETKLHIEVAGRTEGQNMTGFDSTNTKSTASGGKQTPGCLQTISKELVEELTGLPLGSERSGGGEFNPAASEELLDAVLEVLFNLDLETDPLKRSHGIEESALTLSSCAPGLLAALLPQLPSTPVGDAFLLSILQNISPASMEQLVVHLQCLARQEGDGRHQAPAALSRLASIDENVQTGLRERLALHNDARELLASIVDDAIPSQPLQLRLQHPTWSAAVLTAAAQQCSCSTDQEAFGLFNRVLLLFEQEMDVNIQGEVIQQAVARIAQLPTPELCGLLVQQFKGLFGEQLYEKILKLVSDECIDQAIERLTSKQLNRIVAMLVHDIPIQAGGTELDDLIPTDNPLFKKFVRSRHAVKIKAEIAGQLDARALQSPVQSLGDLSDGLRVRLKDLQWPARLLATSAMQATDPVNFQDGKVDFSAHDRMLKRYSLLFDKDELGEIAAEAGSRIAVFGAEELGLILMLPDSTAFGEKVKEEIFKKITATQAERVAIHLRKKKENTGHFALRLGNKALHDAYQKVQQQLHQKQLETNINAHRERTKEPLDAQVPQLQGGLEGLLQGEAETLLLEEVVSGAPGAMLNYLQQGQAELTDSLLDRLGSALNHSNPDIRTNAASTLAASATMLAREQQWPRLDRLLPALKQALRTTGLKNEELEGIVATLAQLGSQCLQEQRYRQAAEAFHVLKNFSETPDEESIQRLLVARLARTALKECASPETLEALLDQYLHSESTRDATASVLISMGIISARFQIQQLLLSESRAERTRILHLIEQGGKASVNALLEQLSMESPWFVTRSTIRLLGELGNSPLFTAIQPFLSHADIRVQEEALQTGASIGGDYYKEFLIRALRNVDDTLKGKVISQIIEVSDDCFVRPLCQLMEAQDTISADHREELQLSIVQALERIGSKRALAALAEMATSIEKDAGSDVINKTVRQAAVQAAERLRLTGIAQVQTSVEASRNYVEQKPEAAHSNTAPTIQVNAPPPVRTPEENQFFQLVEQGEIEKAKGLLLGLVSATAQKGDFAKAEGLKHHLYSIEGLALREIIQAEELIEQAKQQLIPQEDLRIWEALHNELSTEEFQTIYHCFEHRLYAAEEPMVKQGERNDHLFFINQGSVKVSYSDGKKEIFVTTLNRGHLAGESFFTPSVWTVTLTALIRVQAYLLPRSVIAPWEERFPGLRNKLLRFYSTFDNTWSFLERKKLERRKHERFSLTRKILVQPLNQHGHPMGRGFRAETLDASIGGLAFLVRIGRRENARILLGRKMQAVIPVNGDAPYQYLPGMIIGVQPYQLLENDYSVHFRFDRIIHEEQLDIILR